MLRIFQGSYERDEKYKRKKEFSHLPLYGLFICKDR